MFGPADHDQTEKYMRVVSFCKSIMMGHGESFFRRISHVGRQVKHDAIFSGICATEFSMLKDVK